MIRHSANDQSAKDQRANDQIVNIRPAYLLWASVYWNASETQSKLTASCQIRPKTQTTKGAFSGGEIR
jgi:hypothetical protein